MAEDQGVNGTNWNKQAAKLLSFYDWEKIGDFDMDIEGSNNAKYGIDTFMKFNTPLKNNPQSIILEAKRYLTTSFQKSLLQDWIKRLDVKLSELKDSNILLKQFPILQDCTTLDVGIIAIWFHDIDNYKNFQEKFNRALSEIHTSNKARKNGAYNKIYVLDNSLILKLCSLHNTINQYQAVKKCDIEFYYPSALIEEKPIVRKKTLTVEYIFSKIILAESKDSSNKSEKLVFYFGNIEVNGFKQLRSLLSGFSFLEEGKSVILFVYQQNDDFRKIKPEIEKIFNDIEFYIKSMDNLNDLPGIIKDID